MASCQLYSFVFGWLRQIDFLNDELDEDLSRMTMPEKKAPEDSEPVRA